MNDILNVSSKNSYLTTKQWKEVVEYVKNRKNIINESVIEEVVVQEEIVESKRSEAYEKMIQTTSVSEMYEVLLTIMNEEPEKLYEMTLDELQALYDTATQMNKENLSDDYQDLADTLQYIAGDYDLNGVEVLTPSGTILNSSGGTLSNGDYYLNTDITLTTHLTVSAGTKVTIDLNGHVLQTTNGFICIVENSGTLTITDSNPNVSHFGTLNNNGVWIYSPSNTTGQEIKGGIVTGGSGDRGGAFLVRGNLILEKGTIAGCVAQETDPDNENEIHQPTGGAGGAVFIDASNTFSGTFTMNGGAIKYCSSDPDINSFGGAVFIDAENSNYGKFIMNGGLIEHCKSYRGGAIYVHKALADNATGYGVFTMAGGQISNNISRECGGAIYTTGKFVMDNGVINNNKTAATGDILDEAPVHTGYGGGVYLLGKSATFTMNDGTISENISASGGGIMVYTDSVFTMNGGTISGNFATGTGGTGNGGAVYVNSSTFNFNQGTLQNNWARRYGGAININQTATISLNGECKILNNSANHGGGISQEAGDCRLELSNENILISGNVARNVSAEGSDGSGGAGNGGGLFIEKGILNFSSGTIRDNTAAGKGGGLSMCVKRINGNVTVNMTGGNIINNTSGSTGGGIDIFSDYEDDSSTINNIVVSLYGGLIDNNKSGDNGGGIQVWVNEANSKSFIYIGQSTSNIEPIIINNYSKVNGGAVSIASGDIVISKGSIYNNSAKNNGGSIYIDGGNFTMTNGTFDNNTAEVSGGAIYVTGGDINIESGNITNNIALDKGGAIAVTSGNVTMGTEECHDAGESSSHIHPAIENNIASDGGGIYVDGGITTMWCGDIKHNLTYDKTVNVLVISGGNFVYNGGTIGIPYDSGVFVNGGIFEDNSSESESVLKHELHYHSVLGNETYNGRIPESKWIASPRGDIINVTDYDSSSVIWADLYPDYEFVGWESRPETDTDETVNLYAIWEKRFFNQ